MKAVTLLCGIVFTLSVCLGVYNLLQNISRFHFAPIAYLSQGAWLLGQCCLVAFFFTLYSRQR